MLHSLKNKKVIVNAPWEISTVEENISLQIEGPNEVIIKNKVSHISAGTELACIAGLESWFEIPATPGYTAVGEIIDKGDLVSNFEIGDLVYTFGPHARYFKIDITDRWHGICVRVPDGLNPDLASFTHMGGIAITALRASNIELGDLVVVSGLGTIGNLAAQFAQLQGATVVGTDINEERIQIAKRCGIRQTINVAEKDLSAELLALTGREKADCWIDASGQPAVIEKPPAISMPMAN
jgi:threonine dehydrogenase-like Zn-dependent dehydrogenase